MPQWSDHQIIRSSADPMTQFPIHVRDVTRGDLDALAALRPTRELHAARVCSDIDDDAKRYFLAEMSGSSDAGDARRPVGFGVIYFRGEPTWRRPDRVPL